MYYLIKVLVVLIPAYVVLQIATVARPCSPTARLLACLPLVITIPAFCGVGFTPSYRFPLTAVCGLSIPWLLHVKAAYPTGDQKGPQSSPGLQLLKAATGCVGGIVTAIAIITTICFVVTIPGPGDQRAGFEMSMIFYVMPLLMMILAPIGMKLATRSSREK